MSGDGAWRALVRRHWKVALPVALAVAALGGWLVFGFFGLHTLFIDETVDEAPPSFEAGAGASGLPSDAVSEDLADAMSDAMADAPAEIEVAEVMPGAPEIMAEGVFVDRSHPTEGVAKVLGDGSGRRFLRFEGFRTDNGPDLNVYLSSAPPDAPADAFDEDFVDLGDLKGNVGDQNYEIPAGVDLNRYRTVVVWCVRFSVAFGAAPLG